MCPRFDKRVVQGRWSFPKGAPAPMPKRYRSWLNGTYGQEVRHCTAFSADALGQKPHMGREAV